MEPTNNYVIDGNFTLRYIKSAGVFYVMDFIDNIGNRTADYETGWFYQNSGISQTTTWGANFSHRLRYKVYFSNRSTLYSGAALNYRANTASVSLQLKYTGNSTTGVSSIIYALPSSLDEFFDDSSNYHQVIGHMIYADTPSYNSVVTATFTGGTFIVRKLDRSNFQTDNDLIDFYFNFTIPIVNPNTP